jgi:MFS family permease
MAQKLQAPVTSAPSRQSAGFLSRFTVLKGAPHELWVVFIFQVVAILAYQAMNMTFTLWLSSDLGFNDEWSGYVVATWAVLITFFAVLVGSLADAVGLRRAFFLGVWICILSRAVITFATFKWVALIVGMLPLAVGEALGTPVLVASIRRFSNTAQRTIAFSIFYAMMNGGFLLANLLFDGLRSSLGEHGHWVVPFLGFRLTTYRVLFLVSLLFELSLLPLVYFGLREGVEATDEGVKINPRKPAHLPSSCGTCGCDLAGNASGVCPKCGAVVEVQGEVQGDFLDVIWHSVSRALVDAFRIFTGLWRQPGFYKFLAFLGLAAFVRLVFVHMSYTFPKFGIRELGEGAPVGRLAGINNILIMVLVPIVGALSQKVAAYRMVTLGTVIGAASVFVMAMPPVWFQGVADSPLGRWIGHGYLGLEGSINPYYVSIFLFITLLSIGEAVYSPRTYEYAACIAPRGQEASYMSISYLPYLVAKFAAAMSSGVLLARYCPETGPRHSEILWLIIALTAVIGPVGLIAFRRWIRVPEAGREN